MKDSPPSVKIRAELPADIPAVRRVTIAAFQSAAHTSHTEQFIVDALRSAGKITVSTVATQDDDIIGHVAVSPITIDGAQGRWFGLGPVSVLPNHQRRGIGSALVMNALVILSSTGAAGCVVLGDPAFYERFGFKATSALTLPGVSAAHFMAVAFDSSVPHGTVAYHDAFEAHA